MQRKKNWNRLMMRVSEIIGLKPSDISFSDPKTIRVLGKGSKIRYVPLVKQAEKPLKKYMDENRLFDVVLL